MRAVEWAEDAAGDPQMKATRGGVAGAASPDLLGALTGRQAGRERAVAEKTRRVVMASLGVMEEQKAGRKRSRSLALASLLAMVVALGPFVWRVADDLISGERLSDVATQTSLWACILFPAVLGAVLVAGWSRNRP